MNRTYIVSLVFDVVQDPDADCEDAIMLTGEAALPVWLDDFEHAAKRWRGLAAHEVVGMTREGDRHVVVVRLTLRETDRHIKTEVYENILHTGVSGDILAAAAI
jgi:hypothetical protein